MIFIVRPNSIIDVITNSSSEIFVMEGNKEMDFIRDVLVKLLEATNLAEGRNDKLDDILTIRKATKEDETEHDAVKYYDTEIQEGEILIESTSDNTIPWQMQTFIEDTFNAKRTHLG
jgi:hypothetical protein